MWLEKKYLNNTFEGFRTNALKQESPSFLFLISEMTKLEIEKIFWSELFLPLDKLLPGHLLSSRPP